MMDANYAKYCVFFLCIVIAAASKTTNDIFLEQCEQKSALSIYMNVTAESIDKAKNSFKTCRKNTVDCDQTSHYLEVAEEMTKKALIADFTIHSSTPDVPNTKKGILDCSDIMLRGYTKSGVYRISAPINRLIEDDTPITVYCDMETDGGGWTVIQRRGDYNNSVDYFFKEFKSYKLGFGDVEKEFWLGNDNIFALTLQKYYSVRFDLEDYSGNKRYANYDEFSIGDEYSQYTLYINKYSGDAGDAMKNSQGAKFTTIDRENEHKCAEKHKGGWWYSACYHGHLNGEKLKAKHNQGIYNGITWYQWKGWGESLEKTEIKIRPYKFNRALCSSV